MKTITYKEFVENYRPIKNQFNPVADYDDTLYSPIEFSQIATTSLPNRLLWTLLQVNYFDDKTCECVTEKYIYQGLQEFGDVIGYFVTEEPYEYGKPVKVVVDRETIDN